MTPVQLNARLERLEAKKNRALDNLNYRKAAKIVDRQTEIVQYLNRLLDKEIELAQAGPRRGIFLPEN